MAFVDRQVSKTAVKGVVLIIASLRSWSGNTYSNVLGKGMNTKSVHVQRHENVNKVDPIVFDKTEHTYAKSKLWISPERKTK
jgi:hypothetical protein